MTQPRGQQGCDTQQLNTWTEVVSLMQCCTFKAYKHPEQSRTSLCFQKLSPHHLLGKLKN